MSPVYAVSAKDSANRTLFVKSMNLRHDEIQWTKVFDQAKKFGDKPSALEVYDYLLERGIHGVSMHFVTRS